MIGTDDYATSEKLNTLVGKKVTAVWWGDVDLTFDTDQGLVGFALDADCCSYSYFSDIIGVDKLLENGPVIDVNAIQDRDPEYFGEYDRGTLQHYGFEIVTEHPKWGDMTTVVSFRNESNGYYGGRLVRSQDEVHPTQRKWVNYVVCA